MEIDVKNIIKLIQAKFANEFIKKHHYSGKAMNNSKLHFGSDFTIVFCNGVLSLGSPLDKRKALGFGY